MLSAAWAGVRWWSCGTIERVLSLTTLQANCAMPMFLREIFRSVRRSTRPRHSSRIAMVSTPVVESVEPRVLLSGMAAEFEETSVATIEPNSPAGHSGSLAFPFDAAGVVALRGTFPGLADWYRFSLDEPTLVTFWHDNPDPNLVAVLKNGAENNVRVLRTADLICDDGARVLQPGTYFVRVVRLSSSQSIAYDIRIKFDTIVEDNEPNDRANPTLLPANDRVLIDGSVGGSEDPFGQDDYDFALDSTKHVKFRLENLTETAVIALVAPDNSVVFARTVRDPSFEIEQNLSKIDEGDGLYTVRVFASDTTVQTDYTLTIDLSQPAVQGEDGDGALTPPNDTAAGAIPLASNTSHTIDSTLSYGDLADWYEFTFDSEDYLNVTFTAPTKDLTLVIKDGSGTNLMRVDTNRSNGGINTYSAALPAGTYYLRIVRTRTFIDFGGETIRNIRERGYQLVIDVGVPPLTDVEPFNNTAASAGTIPVDVGSRSTSGMLASDDPADFYEVVVDRNKTLFIESTTSSTGLQVEVQDDTGASLTSGLVQPDGSIDLRQELPAGVYYVVVADPDAATRGVDAVYNLDFEFFLTPGKSTVVIPPVRSWTISDSVGSVFSPDGGFIIRNNGDRFETTVDANTDIAFVITEVGTGIRLQLSRYNGTSREVRFATNIDQTRLDADGGEVRIDYVLTPGRYDIQLTALSDRTPYTITFDFE